MRSFLFNVAVSSMVVGAFAACVAVAPDRPEEFHADGSPVERYDVEIGVDTPGRAALDMAGAIKGRAESYYAPQWGGIE